MIAPPPKHQTHPAQQDSEHNPPDASVPVLPSQAAVDPHFYMCYIDLNGATVGHGSPAFTITAPNVTLQNGVLDGEGDDSPALLLEAGADNFALFDLP